MLFQVKFVCDSESVFDDEVIERHEKTMSESALWLLTSMQNNMSLLLKNSQ
jgi:hypothetical protein